MVEQIFRSPQVKQSVLISHKLVHTSYLTSCRTTLDLSGNTRKILKFHRKIT